MPNCIKVRLLNGVLSPIDPDRSVWVEPNIKSLLPRGLVSDWNHEGQWRPVAEAISDRIERMLSGDPGDEWHGMRPVVTRLYYHPDRRFYFMMAFIYSLVAKPERWFEVSDEEASAWKEANLIDPAWPYSANEPMQRPKEASTKAAGGIEASSDASRVGHTSKLKQPSDKAIQCYRLKFVTGAEKDQASIATDVYGNRSKQYQVSRDLKAVAKWIKAGNVLPNLDETKPKTYPVDPSKLNKGRRLDTGRRSDE